MTIINNNYKKEFVMFGSSHGTNEYARIGIETGVAAATPHRLIVMLYDGAIQACILAIKHIENGDIEAKGLALSKAIMILESGLRLSLDKKVGGNIAKSLDSLYGYMSNRLYIANIKNSTEPVNEVLKFLLDLRGAWEAIGQKIPKAA